MLIIDKKQSINLFNWPSWVDQFWKTVVGSNELNWIESIMWLWISHRNRYTINYNSIDGRFLKLCDFGLSKEHEFDWMWHTKQQGTRGYMAPEVIFGFNGKFHYTTKADVLTMVNTRPEFPLVVSYHISKLIRNG